MKVLVAGGTGSAGAPLVRELLGRGHTVRVLTRSGAGPDGAECARGDLSTGDGLDAAVRDVAAVVHVANGIGRTASRVLVDGTRHLTGAAADAGVPHVVALSICGIDGVPWSYYRVKVEQERVLMASGVPWTVVRATQFHELLTWLFTSTSRAGVVVVPKAVLVRPVAAEVVGAALADVVEAGPSGRTRDVAGPEVLTIEDAAKAWRAATHRRQPLLAVRVPGTVGRRLRAGAFVPAEPLVDGPSYAQWLAARATTTQPAQ